MSDIWLTKVILGARVGAGELIFGFIEGDKTSGKLIINSETISGMNKCIFEYNIFMQMRIQEESLNCYISICSKTTFICLKKHNKNKLLVWEERAINKQWIGKAFLP